MKRIGPQGRALILGCSGGVGTAVLNLLAHSANGRRILQTLERIYLVGRAPGPTLPMPHLGAASPERISRADDLARMLGSHRIDQVIDLASLGTLDCVLACESSGASYLSTSVEEWVRDEPTLTHRLMEPLLPGARPNLSRQSHLIGAGMNPGVVNALVFAGIYAFARLARVAPSAEALELHAVLITEDDATEEVPPRGDTDTFAMSWSPRHCLAELLEPEAIAVRHGRLVGLGHPPRTGRYLARCGEAIIEGMVVPHEEVITLGCCLPTLELAFIYRIPPAAQRALDAHPERTNVRDWSTRKMYPPHTRALRGRDCVGVLLCSRRFGELWIGYDTDVSAGLEYGTSATQLQVAAGVLAGWNQLGARTGIHFVEDLDWRAYLDDVETLLGPASIVRDASAPPRTLLERRVH